MVGTAAVCRYIRVSGYSVIQDQRRMCGDCHSHADRIWYSGSCALETVLMVMIVVSVFLSSTTS